MNLAAAGQEDLLDLAVDLHPAPQFARQAAFVCGVGDALRDGIAQILKTADDAFVAEAARVGRDGDLEVRDLRHLGDVDDGDLLARVPGQPPRADPV